MGIMDFFKASENKKIKSELEEIKEKLTPEQLQYFNFKNEIKTLKDNKDSLEKDILKLESKKDKLRYELEEKKKELIQLDENILMQEFGLYIPLYDFANSNLYKEKLEHIRTNQKRMIADKTAVYYSDNWTVDGSKAKGRKMTNDNIKQILMTFNIECDNLIAKVKYNNISSIQDRITKTFSRLNKLNESVRVSIRTSYLESKIDELKLAYEYQVKKQQEKEEERRIKEELREEAKLQRELEEARKNTAKDLKHFQNALEEVNKKISECDSDYERDELLKRKYELENEISNIQIKLKDIDYRQNNQKAGYVYIISNIGAFGRNVYKIGMTRRLNPTERVDELGDASVPFKFDIHAMIFSEDAPKLENALHQAFDNKKINMVNKRKEFFNVTLDQIEEVVKQNYDKLVEFKKEPEAEQYRESIIIRNNN